MDGVERRAIMSITDIEIVASNTYKISDKKNESGPFSLHRRIVISD